MIRSFLAALLMVGPAVAQPASVASNPIANSINTTNAGQATGTVLNSNTQLNQLPIMQQEYGAGFRCQNATLSVSPYYVGTDTGYGSGSVSGFGGMVSISMPLDGRGVEYCMAMAKARVAKEEFDLAMTRTLKCADLLRAGIVFTNEEMQQMCDGIAYDPRRDTSKGVILPDQQKTPQVTITR